jgi:hypothetical protein
LPEEQFNPYHTWLGFDVDNRNPSYPDLLGVSEDETDTEILSKAFDRVIAKVRSHKPGPQAAEWARLIDELKATRLAALKMGFAAVLKVQPSTKATDDDPTATAATHSAAVDSVPAPTPQIGEAATVEATHDSSSSDAILAALGLDDDDGLPDFTTPDDEVDVDTPADLEVDTPAEVEKPDIEAAANVPSSIPPTAPLASPAPTAAASDAVPAIPQPPAQENAATASRGLVTTAAAQRRGNYFGLIVGFASCALMVSVFAFAYYLGFGSNNGGDDEVAMSTDPVHRELENNDEPANSDPEIRNGQDSTMTSDPDTMHDEPSPGEDPDEPSMDDEPTTEPPETTQPPPPPPTPEDRDLSDEELKKFAGVLKSVKEALGKQQIGAANSLLEEAKPLAGTKTHRAMIERLEMLSAYVEAFHNAVQQSLKKLSPGDSFPVTPSTLVALVEKKPESIIIHVAGFNKEYALNELSLGLGLALANQSLDQTALSTLVLKGAFQSIHPKSSEQHIQEVRDWWRSAADGGEEIGDLILVLDDDYGRLAGEE